MDFLVRKKNAAGDNYYPVHTNIYACMCTNV
jgi:hypothetical protein